MRKLLRTMKVMENLKMAANSGVDISKLSEVFPLTWSVDTKHDVFQRWSQGFFFSEDEPTALIQNYGGPCSVIASVQAYLVRRLIFKKCKKAEKEDWRTINDKDRQHLLCQTLIDIWELVTTENFHVVLMKNHYINEGSENERLETVQTIGESSTQGEETCECTCKDYHRNICSQTESQTQDVFHSALRQFSCRKSEHLEDFIVKNIHQFEGTFGVLLFLYSILLSKGIENIKSEMDETLTSPLIDPVHGHGGQSLVNLMLTGYAVSHVWDLERDIGGLILKGIPKQSSIGFLSLLESMRYCEVGNFLKSPKEPIWLLASETHLTVLFTKENVDDKRPVDNAIRIFKTYDTQENGFIERAKLKDVLEELELESDQDYVSFMESCLDPDSSGIILLHTFLQVFYPEEKNSVSEQSDFAKCFPVYHYNGLAKCCSKEDNRKKVVYSEGVCTLLSGDVICLSDGPFLNCLRTKWPYVIIDWKTEPKPSLN